MLNKAQNSQTSENLPSLAQIADDLSATSLDILIQDIAKIIRSQAYKVGEKKATDILSSRFMSAQDAFNQGIMSCGTLTNISAEMLRHKGYEVKLVHGSIPQTPTHAWISVQDPVKKEWHQFDLAQKDTHVTPEHKAEFMVDDWEEIRPFLEDWAKSHQTKEDL